MGHKQGALDLKRSNEDNVDLTYEHVTWFLVDTFFSWLFQRLVQSHTLMYMYNMIRVLYHISQPENSTSYVILH